MPTAQALHPRDRVRRSSSVFSAEVNGQSVLLDTDSQNFVGLDAVGSEIWRRLETPKRIEQLCDEICNHFDGEKAVIVQECTAFLEVLWTHDLVDMAPVQYSDTDSR